MTSIIVARSDGCELPPISPNGFFDQELCNGAAGIWLGVSAPTSRYRLEPHSLSATYLSRAVASMRADLPSGKAPTTRVRLRISRPSRSMALLVRMRRQCSRGNLVYVRVSVKPSRTTLAASPSLMRSSSPATSRALASEASRDSMACMALSMAVTTR